MTGKGVGTGGAGGGGVKTPVTILVARVAGKPPISTVGLPWVTVPTYSAGGIEPVTASDITEAGPPQIMTVGTPGPVMGQVGAVTKSSPTREAGNGMLVSLADGNTHEHSYHSTLWREQTPARFGAGEPSQ
jgi:hypothetical protein